MTFSSFVKMVGKICRRPADKTPKNNPDTAAKHTPALAEIQ